MSNAAARALLANSPYKQSQKPSHSGLLLRKYEENMRNRKFKLSGLRNPDLEESEIMRLIYEIRQMTLSLIEDGLEFEYMSNKNHKIMKKGKLKTLLPIMRYSTSKLIEDQSNCYIFNDIISDNEDIFLLPHMKNILGSDNIPKKRNPFFLGKTIDELCTMQVSPMVIGTSNTTVNDQSTNNNNNSSGMNALELLRYRRCADVLLKAELQINYKLPLSPGDIAHVWHMKNENPELDILLRCMQTIIHNEGKATFTEDCLRHLADAPFVIDPGEFLVKLNEYKGVEPLLTNVQAAVRQQLAACNLKPFLQDPQLQFLVEWVNSAMNFKSSSLEESSSIISSSSRPGQGGVLPSSQGDTAGKAKKQALVGIQSMARIKQEIERSVKTQVTKAFAEVKAGGSMGGKKHEPDNSGSEVVENMRYELLKLQQELLKRNVLNPLHYKATSVDVSSNETARIATESRQRHTVRLSVLMTQPITWGQHQEGSLEVCLDTELEALVMRFIRVNKDGSSVITSQGLAVEREVMGYIKIDKLEYNRLTGQVMEEFLAAPNKKKGLFLKPILLRISDFLEKSSELRGRMYLDMDRLVYKDSVNVSGVAVDILMVRNIDSSGILIHCHPLQVTSLSHGVITVSITDKELVILLINQRSLLTLAQSKWSCMETVGTWLSNRLVIHKIALTHTTAATSVGTVEHSPSKTLTGMTALTDEVSMSSPMKTPLSSNNLEPTPLSPIMTTPSTMSGGYEALQITLNRSIELADAVVIEWRNRNIPHLPGIEVSLRAFQEMELLRLDIQIMYTESIENIEALETHDLQLLPPPSRSSRDRNSNSSRSNNNDRNIDVNVPPRTFEVPLVCRLSGPELLIFGKTEMLQDSKVSLGSQIDVLHPSSFMWNIVSRIFVLFNNMDEDGGIRYIQDQANWSINIDRRLFREIRTISGLVLIVTVCVVGSDLIIEAERTHNAQQISIGRKVFTEEEISEVVYAEGWPVSMVQHSERVQVAHKLLERMKIVTENGLSRLEPLHYAEKRMLTISVRAGGGGGGGDDIVLGDVEISEFMTLTDLRSVIRHELDETLLPRNYRILYRGTPCSVRQEPYRRAWDCLPTCCIQVKAAAVGAGDRSSSSQQQQSEVESEFQAEASRMIGTRGDSVTVGVPRNRQRGRAANTDGGDKALTAPVLPVPTLGRIQETTNKLYLLHDMSRELRVGQSIKIGLLTGRSYTITGVAGKVVTISPAFDLADGARNGEPMVFNCPYTKQKFSELFPSIAKLGYTYDEPPPLDAETDERQNTTLKGDVYLTLDDDANKDGLSSTSKTTQQQQQQLQMMTGGGGAAFIHEDVWLWKIAEDPVDPRPMWRKEYDAGNVPYKYTHQRGPSSLLLYKYFRVSIPYSYMEACCVDARVPSLSVYTNRANLISSVPLEHFTAVVFKKMVEWYPQSEHGIDGSKFIKLLRETEVFSDLKKSARVTQIDIMFKAEAKGPNGHADKYVNYQGFLKVLRKLALVRYPVETSQGDEEGGEGRPSSSSATGVVRSSTPAIAASPSRGGVGVSVRGGGSKPSSPAAAGGGGGQGMDRPVRTPGSVNSSRPTSRERPRGASAVNTTTVAVTSGATTLRRRKRPSPAMSALIEESHSKLITRHIASLTAWLDPIWEEAKLIAMTYEAKRYCAATRIIAFYRGLRMKYYFSIYIFCIIELQANIRRKLCQWRIQKLILSLQHDWIFRQRIHHSTLLQALARGFIIRRRFAKTMELLSQQHMAFIRQERNRLRKLRLQEKKGVLYMKMKQVSQYAVVVKISRKDWRNFKDLGVIIKAYVLASQETFRFELTTDMLRAYMCQELKVSAVSVGDILNNHNLDLLMQSRLMIRVPMHGKKLPKVFFSKHALGQQGSQVLVQGIRIGGYPFIVTLYSTVTTISASCYHVHSSTVFTAAVGMADVTAWVHSEAASMRTNTSATSSAMIVTAANTEEEQSQPLPEQQQQQYDEFKQPELLKPANAKHLYRWLVENLVLDLRRQSFKLVFRCQLDKSRRQDYALILQRVWRGYTARKLAVRQLLTTLLKVKDVNSGEYYYINRNTGQSTWEKPSVLLNYDLPVEDKWLDIRYVSNERVEVIQYVNPLRGTYTYMSMDTAASKIRRTYRNHMLKVHKLHATDFQRVLAVITNAKSAYDKDPSKLLHVINLALVAHFVDGNERLARMLYRQALDLSDSNPLVIRAHAIFLLGTCEAPVAANRERAIELLDDANRRDSKIAKFDLAYQIVKYSLYQNPRNSQSLLNMALVEHFVYRNKLHAEKYLRRALILDSFSERLLENWKYFKDIYAEKRQLYYAPSAYEKANTNKGSKKSMINGRAVLEDPSWAGWSYVERDEYGRSHVMEAYWYHLVSGESSWTQPDFKVEWQKRLLRSKYEGAKYGLEYYFDPYTATHFQYHPLSETFQ